MRLPAALAAFVILAACAPAEIQTGPQPITDSGWSLAAGESSLSFVSIKSGTIAEAHSFTALSGSVGADGEAELTVDLNSVETGIEIRNERMREHLFQTGDHPRAHLRTSVDPEAFAGLSVGDRMQTMLSAELDLHGAAIPLEADVYVTRIAEDRVSVTSVAPVLLHAADFGLLEGLATLQELAGLPSISPAVPVSFSLVFERS